MNTILIIGISMVYFFDESYESIERFNINETAISNETAIPGDTIQILELNNTNPEIQFPVPLDVISTIKKVISVQVKEVRNPGLVPVTITLLFSDCYANKWAIGNFSLYPADRPGIFNFRIPDNILEDFAKQTTKVGNTYYLNLVLNRNGFENEKETDLNMLRILILEPVFE